MAEAAETAEVSQVVIIGAGIAGLQCARLLTEAGLKVVVLEARNRFGGRAYSTQEPEGVDLGPSWIWSGDRRVLRLLKDLGLETVPQQMDGQAVLQRGPQAQRLPAQHGASMIPCGPGALRVKGGYAKAAAALASKLPSGTLRLGCKVHSVTKSEESVVVQYETEASEEEPRERQFRISTSRVVVAVPPSIVASAITFKPELPPHHLARMMRTQTWAGDWTKVVVSFQSAFWREQGLSGVAYAQDGPVTMWWEACAEGEQSSSPALGGFAFGFDTKLGKRQSGLVSPTDSDGKAILQQLNRLFGDRVKPPLEEQVLAIHCQSWPTESLTTLNTAEAAKGGGDPRALYGAIELSQALPWGVHFAGTETEDESGHVEGAVKSAERVAKEVLKEVHPAHN